MLSTLTKTNFNSGGMLKLFSANALNLDWSKKLLLVKELKKLKAFEDLKVDEMMDLVFDRAEKNCGKKEKNADYQHFLLLPPMFSIGFFLRIVYICDCTIKCKYILVFQIKDKRAQVKEAKKQLKEAKAAFKAEKTQKNKM